MSIGIRRLANGSTPNPSPSKVMAPSNGGADSSAKITGEGVWRPFTVNSAFPTRHWVLRPSARMAVRSSKGMIPKDSSRDGGKLAVSGACINETLNGCETSGVQKIADSEFYKDHKLIHHALLSGLKINRLFKILKMRIARDHLHSIPLSGCQDDCIGHAQSPRDTDLCRSKSEILI